MKKFINEYKALRACKSATNSSQSEHNGSKVESPVEMGVFKWLRRERVTVSVSSDALPSQEQRQGDAQDQATPVGTIRTEEYKRDLAEFQARRSTDNNPVASAHTKEYQRDLAEFQARRSTDNKNLPELPDTPVKRKSGRNSLPVPCTDCSTAHDNTFNYEKKSATKYKKKNHKRAKSVANERLPNIHFLFQNQVFMPGNYAYTEPQKSTKYHRKDRSPHRSPDFIVQKQIDFEDVDQETSPTPLFYKNNSLPFDSKQFLECSAVEEVDGVRERDTSGSLSDALSDKEKEDSNRSVNNLLEVMSELKHFDQWADEQLREQDCPKSDDNVSETSAFGLPIASARNLDVDCDGSRLWRRGTWGVVPVQLKKITGVSLETVRKNVEISILRKCRHPNIILLMGLLPDMQNNIHIICEQCIDSLFGILHIQGRILSAQTAVHYALDIASALAFLRMHHILHSALCSHSVMVTRHDTAKLADLGPCVRLPPEPQLATNDYGMYSPEPQYVNIEQTRDSTMPESEPLLSKRSSEAYLDSNSVSKEYATYRDSEHYRWQAPELFEPDAEGMVHPCEKSDVYSLCLVLWESCNAAVPWKTFTYGKLKEQYLLWKTGIVLPKDGTYPGGLLALLESGLTLSREDRIDLTTLHKTLVNVKYKLDDLEYFIIPARISKKKSNFSSVAWETNSPTDESECLSPIVEKMQHNAVIHKNYTSTDTSEKDPKSDSSVIYETIRNEKYNERLTNEKCFISDEEPSEERPLVIYQHFPEKEISSACSTPLAKVKSRMKDLTPGALHRSDSTEYCSILSPDNKYFAINVDNSNTGEEKPTVKLSRSFTPKSYKPLHIRLPEFSLDSVKTILKENSVSEKSSYNFDIKNYSLPSTPIARSNKLRKNAWLSGELSATERAAVKVQESKSLTPSRDIIGPTTVPSQPETPIVSNNSSTEKHSLGSNTCKQSLDEKRGNDLQKTDKESFTGLRRVDPPPDYSSEADSLRDRTNSWSFKSTLERPSKIRAEEEGVLSKVNVKPLVAIHERWIYEANRKTGRSMSLPDDNRSVVQAVKPASHCVDTLQKSLPQLSVKRASSKSFRPHPAHPPSPGATKSGSNWENFCQARDTVARNMTFGSRDWDRFQIGKEDKGVSSDFTQSEPKIDRAASTDTPTQSSVATDTGGIEEFIRDLIRKEFQHLLHEISDDVSSSTAPRNEEILDKGVANIVENLKNGETEKKEFKSFSRVKINGNNKPLLQITFTRTGENSLQVLDNCVHVTLSDNNTSGKDKFDISMEETLTGEDVQTHSLKRCQAFNALQEARSTEDLYIDDDLQSQLADSFGRVRLLPVHGSLHAVLCEREDDCCLVQLQRESGADTIFFRVDNSDTESRDAIDGGGGGGGGSPLAQDTVLFKRSISVVEERIQRVYPKEKRPQPVSPRPASSVRVRPKSEVYVHRLAADSRARSNSSPALGGGEPVEVNIENVMSYQDSSSEECIQCQEEQEQKIESDFQQLEQKIAQDLVSTLSSVTSCLHKISEENLSVCDEADA